MIKLLRLFVATLNTVESRGRGDNSLLPKKQYETASASRLFCFTFNSVVDLRVRFESVCPVVAPDTSGR